MTRSHRRRHVVMWVVLAPLILVAILLAVRARLDRAAALGPGPTPEAAS